MTRRRTMLIAAIICVAVFLIAVVTLELIKIDTSKRRYSVYAELLGESLWVMDKPEARERLQQYVNVDGLLLARIRHLNGSLFAEYKSPVGIVNQPDRFLFEHGIMKPRLVRVPIRYNGTTVGTLEALAPDRTLYAHTHSAFFFVVVLMIIFYNITQREQRERLAAHERKLEQERKEREEAERFQKELEQRVVERTIDLENLNAELESFAYSVSHDLRAPLRAIVGFGNALKEDYSDSLDTEGIEFLERVIGAAKRMNEQISGLLTLSRSTRGDLRLGKVDLSVTAEQLIGELHSIEPERDIEVNIADDLIVPSADDSMAKTVLENLLTNAWKFTSREENAQITVGRTTEDAVPVFFVRDNGVGFEAEYSDQLFKAFRRLHSAEDFPGTGVGLATVQRIINRHGGRVWAEATPGEGATFYFTFEKTQQIMEGEIEA